MRGVATLCVAIYHSFIWRFIDGQPYMILPVWAQKSVQSALARIVVSATSGPAWVDFFFVLSGFVLAQSLATFNLSWAEWHRFVSRRVLRIMPAFVAALCVISIFLWIRVHYKIGTNAADGWYPKWHFINFSAGRFLKTFLFVDPELDPPSWTLRVEMIAAIFFPVVFSVYRSISLRLACAIWLGIAITACVLDFSGLVSGMSTRFAGPVIGNYMFLIGITCALHGRRLSNRLSDRQLSAVAVLSVLMLTLVSLPFRHANSFTHFIAGLGSLGLVCVLASDRPVDGFGWLDWRVFRFLGRISFSFYVLHYGVLYMTTVALTAHRNSELWERMGLGYMMLCMIVSIACCAPLAWLLYRYVERPSMSLGRRFFSSKAQTKGTATSQSGLPTSMAR
jgi:peptidoglycan/LPS O-acetylase OafA/YrhL